jgi:hypothetical protein
MAQPISFTPTSQPLGEMVSIALPIVSPYGTVASCVLALWPPVAPRAVPKLFAFTLPPSRGIFGLSWASLVSKSSLYFYCTPHPALGGGRCQRVTRWAEKDRSNFLLGCVARAVRWTWLAE